MAFLLIRQHQGGIHLGDFFSNQTKLRRLHGVCPVVESDRPECQDCFAGFLHAGDVFLEPLRGSNRATPVVLFASALLPIATLFSPVESFRSASRPTAVLLLPVA
jgi:hypothetical protein